MRIRLRWAATGLALAAAGCASDPVHFHSLVPRPASLNSERISPDVMLDLRPVHVPAMVDRSELVVRQHNGGTALLERELWISPLQDELHSALSLELARQLATPHPTAGQGTRRLKVRVNVQRFEGELGHYALIEAEWHLSTSAPGSTPELACRSLHVQSAPGGVTQLVDAYRHSTAALADDIAVAADRLRATADTDCGS
jgi:uncharacterized lipoprotein YmbA